MGVSMGACVALQMAIFAPEKVLSLFLMSPLPLTEVRCMRNAGTMIAHSCTMHVYSGFAPSPRKSQKAVKRSSPTGARHSRPRTGVSLPTVCLSMKRRSKTRKLARGSSGTTMPTLLSAKRKYPIPILPNPPLCLRCQLTLLPSQPHALRHGARNAQLGL